MKSSGFYVDPGFPVYTLVYTNVAKYSVYKEKSDYLF